MQAPLLLGELHCLGDRMVKGNSINAPSRGEDPVSAQEIELLQQASRLTKQDKWEQAIPLLEKVVEYNPDHPAFRSDLAVAYSRVGRVDQAIAEHTAVLQLDTNDPQFHYNLACCCRDHGRVSEARDHLKQALELNPYALDALNVLADTVASLDESTRLLERSLQIAPDQHDVAQLLEQRREIAGQPEATFAQVRLHFASQAALQKHYHGARVEAFCAMEGLTKPAELANACHIVADTYRLEAGEPPTQALLECSIEWSGKAIAHDDSAATRLNDLSARLLILATRYNRPDVLADAERHGRRATEVGDYSKARCNLAKSLLLLHRLSEASQQADRAIEMAEYQLAHGAAGPLVCVGCPWEGKERDRCEDCLARAHGVRGEIGMASGDYSL